MTNPIRPEKVTQWILTSHGDIVRETAAAANRVESRWPSDLVTQREHIVGPLEEELEAADLITRYQGVLQSIREHYGFHPTPAIVPAPPYVIITSRGPILRHPINRSRLLIRFELFDVLPHHPTAYRRRAASPSALVHVEIR